MRELSHASKDIGESPARASLTTYTYSEEINEDVRARMLAIQEEELDQLKELTGFLDMELRFAEQYLSVLKEARSEWPDESVRSCLMYMYRIEWVVFL